MIKAFFATLGVLAALFFAFVFIFILGGSLAEKQSPGPTSAVESDNPMREKNQRFVELYQSTYDTIVREPTRPMADFYQPILELHYLWLEVRDSIYWTSQPKDRATVDMVITKLVDQVSRDKKIRDAFSGR